MKRYYVLLPIFLCVVMLMILPKEAWGYLTPPHSPHPNPSSDFRGGATAGLPLSDSETRQRLGGEVVGDGTPESCTETAFATAFQAGGTITFNCGTDPYTLTLLNTYPVTTTIEIDGGALITLAKQGANRHFDVKNTGTLTLNHLTLQGDLPEGGGGMDIDTLGLVTTENVTFTRNAHLATVLGGAVINRGTLNMTNSRFIENHARLGGGGLFSSGRTRLTNVRFVRNVIDDALTGTIEAYGAGLANNGEMTIIGGEFSNNIAYQSNPGTGSVGGGLFNGGTLDMQDVNFLENHAYQGSAFYTLAGTTTGSRLLVVGNGVQNQTSSTVEVRSAISGGGVLNLTDMQMSLNFSIGVWVGPDSRALLANSTISQNALRSMFVQNANVVSIINSTFSQNFGGLGVYASSVTIEFSTLVDNGEHNLELTESSEVRFRSTVLAGATSGNCVLEFGTNILQSLGHNLASDNTCELIDPTDIPNQPTILLGTLGYHGGFAFTLLPEPGSPLIDQGFCNDEVPTDQRGVERPYGAECDIGSVERGALDDATPTPPATITPTATGSETPTPTGTLTATPTGTLTPTPTGTPPTFDEHLFLPLTQR